MCSSKLRWVVLYMLFFSLLPSHMKTEFVNIGSRLRMSINRLLTLLLKPLNIFIRLYTYLLKGTQSKISKNKQENTQAGQKQLCS